MAIPKIVSTTQMERRDASTITPHDKLALSTVMTSTELNSSEKLLSTTQVASEAIRTNPTTEDQATGKESNEKPWEKYSDLKELYLDAIHEMYPEMNVH